MGLAGTIFFSATDPLDDGAETISLIPAAVSEPLHLFENHMKKRILRQSFIVQMVMVVYIIMTENHVSRKLFGGSVCYQLFGKLFGMPSPFFFFFPVWDSGFFVEE